MTDSESEISKKPQKEVPVVQDQGFFLLPTGDTYDGFFEAKKKDRSLKMHGPGIYKTAEGDEYTGTWDNNNFGVASEEVTITYADGSKYEGYIKDWSYHGPGKYTYPDGSVLFCDFAENCPIGHVTLKDPNGHIWLGKTELGFAWCQPVNHYYDMLEKVREVTKIKRRRVPKASTTSSPEPEVNSKKVQLKT